MRRKIYFIFFMLVSTSLLAQAPLQFNYQAVMRNEGGQPINEQNVSVGISILQDGPEGQVIFNEIHNVVTNEFGLVNLKVGSVESLQGIDWSQGTYYIQVSLDGTIMGSSQLLSVPFAMHAMSSADAFSGNYEDLVNTPDLNEFIAIDQPQAGDIIIKTSTGWQTLEIGQEGQVLSVVSGMPQWINLPDSDNGGGDDDPGTVTDVQGNIYNTIQIGEQWWMAENLRTSQYRNGDELITGLTGTQWEYATQGAYAIYQDNEDNHSTFGKLYNWLAVNDSRGICPTGWKVPSDNDFKILEMYLGMTQEQADGTGMRGNDEGGQLKSTGTDLWNSPNTGATNSSGYTALPGGARSYTADYILINAWGYFWSSTEQTPGYSSWYRVLQNTSQQVMRFYNDQRTGMNIRCIKE